MKICENLALKPLSRPFSASPHSFPPRHTYHFILDETIRMKRLIKTLFQMVKRSIPGSFRCNQLAVIIVSIIMKRYLDNIKIPLYYNDIFISQIW